MTAAGTTENHHGYLDLLRIMGCVAVVAVHVGDTLAPLLGIRTLWIIQLLRAPAVPVFYFAAGVLIAAGATRAAPAGLFMLRKAQRLLVPYVCVSLVIGLLRYVSEQGGYASAVNTNTTILSVFTTGILLTTAAPHLYFLLSLFLLYGASIPLRPILVSPMFCAIALIVYTALFPLIEHGYHLLPLRLPADPGVVESALCGMLYLLAGALWHHIGARVTKGTGRFIWVCFVACVVIGALSKYGDVHLGKGIAIATIFMTLAYLAAAIGVSGLAGKTTHIGAGLTYGIYLFHMPLIVHIVLHALGALQVPAIVVFLCATGIVLLLSAALTFSIGYSPLLSRLFLGSGDGWALFSSRRSS